MAKLGSTWAISPYLLAHGRRVYTAVVLPGVLGSAKWVAHCGGRNSPTARSRALTVEGTSGSTAAAYRATAADDIASRANAEPCTLPHVRSLVVTSRPSLLGTNVPGNG